MSQQPDCKCKVGQVSEMHSVLDEYAGLAERWQDGTSIRVLTEELNKAIIQSELKNTNISQIGQEQSAVYKALHTDELEEAKEIEFRRQLEHSGVDVEELSSNLVSHQTVYRHLKNCLSVSKTDDPAPEKRREKARDTVYALQQRTEIVTESTIKTLTSAGIMEIADADVLVDIQVLCNECGHSMDFETAINQGCECRDS
ncbi:rod-determining factor RdfA [Halorussus marinus]|uniref:rod-determining factor RdfA n=1 Tax=Halorussus marinus TaxID=2505976 RepID=UPI001091A09E|nr:rod-determining factor RdfA [Halorussus marinus]